MTVELPAPLVPADVDLRGLEYMPLLGARLFSSNFNAQATDGEWRAAITLWWASWGQVPAGSLPDDDVILCRLADLGRDIKTWRKVKARALHGFVACSDGRMYHKVICEQALVAWDKRVKERERKANWRKQKDGTGQGRPESVPRDKTETEQGRPESVPADGTRRDGTRRDSVKTSSATGGGFSTVEAPETTDPRPPSEADDPPPTPSPAGRACLAMRGANVHDVNPSHPDLLRLLAAGVTPEDIGATAAECAGKGKARFAYVLATVERRRNEAAQAPQIAAARPVTVPSTDRQAEAFHAAMDERSATATKPPAAILAMAGRIGR